MYEQVNHAVVVKHLNDKSMGLSCGGSYCDLRYCPERLSHGNGSDGFQEKLDHHPLETWHLRDN